MVGFKCRLPGVASFDLGPPSKRNPSQPFALSEFVKILIILKAACILNFGTCWNNYETNPFFIRRFIFSNILGFRFYQIFMIKGGRYFLDL